MSKKPIDTDDDIRLGKNLYRAMKEEKQVNDEKRRVNRVALYFVVLLIVLGFISIALYSLAN
jgi:hypothetical protein